MIDVRFRPISTWIGNYTPDSKRRKGGFSISYNKLLDSLESELRHLGARDTVIEGGWLEYQIRNDGWPKGGAAPSHPAVILSFTSKHGPLRIPCDYFLRYEDNLRAIALHLERLRLSAQFGIAQHGEQYKGWRALPPSSGQDDIHAAARKLAALASCALDVAPKIVYNAETYQATYRLAARRCHPDVDGGSREAWDQLQAVRAALEPLHAKKAEAAS